MAELRRYYQYQCEDCGFRTRSPDRDEAVEVVQRHAAEKHDRQLDEDAIASDLRELELEGLPDNS
jgi:predicted small metal-binding protein